MSDTRNIRVENIQEGDFLVGLDNGYVYEVDNDPDYRGGHLGLVNVTSGQRAIHFHTAQGEEATLLAPDDMPVTVRRPSGDFDDEEDED